MSSPLEDLPYSIDAETRQISAENPTGEKADGCKWEPNPSDPTLCHSEAAADLGRGWKLRPFIPVKAGQAALTSICLCGKIQHFCRIVRGRWLVNQWRKRDCQQKSLHLRVPQALSLLMGSNGACP